MNNNTVEYFLKLGKDILKKEGYESYIIDTELIMMKILNISRVRLFLEYKKEMSDKEILEFKYLICRRAYGMPIKYILGKCEFMSLDFFVNQYTLIPRNDTEILVEKAIELFNENNIKNFIEIGTGTGCISISILNYINNKNIICTAVDISNDAIDVAIKNAKNNNVFENINFIVSDIFENINENMKYDAIISNPPYIKTEDLNNLVKDILYYEPLIALDGGFDGLYFYNKIIVQSEKYLNSGGYIMFEIGYDQGNDVKKILEKNNFRNISVIKDLSGLDRVVIGIKN